MPLSFELRIPFAIIVLLLVYELLEDQENAVKDSKAMFCCAKALLVDRAIYRTKKIKDVLLQ